MNKDEFINRVQQYGEIVEREEAEQVTYAVFKALRSTLPDEEVEEVSETLPDDLEGMWMGGFLQRLVNAFSRMREMDREEFIVRVQDESELPTKEEAHHLSLAVIKTLKEALPKKESDQVGNYLPKDLSAMWRAA